MEPRKDRQSRFHIDKLEERIAPSVSLTLDNAQVSGTLTVTTGGGPASGTLTATQNPGGVIGTITFPPN